MGHADALLQVRAAERIIQILDTADDNLLVAAARSGRADYLVTNDRDLLELPVAFPRTLPFAIVTPETFLADWESK